MNPVCSRVRIQPMFRTFIWNLKEQPTRVRARAHSNERLLLQQRPRYFVTFHVEGTGPPVCGGGRGWYRFIVRARCVCARGQVDSEWQREFQPDRRIDCLEIGKEY